MTHRLDIAADLAVRACLDCPDAGPANRGRSNKLATGFNARARPKIGVKMNYEGWGRVDAPIIWCSSKRVPKAWLTPMF